MKRLASKRWKLILLPAIIALLTVTTIVTATGQGGRQPVTTSGGGPIENDTVIVNSAIGQPIVGVVKQEITLCSGYHCGAKAPVAPGDDDPPETVYLPLVIGQSGSQ